MLLWLPPHPAHSCPAPAACFVSQTCDRGHVAHLNKRLGGERAQICSFISLSVLRGCAGAAGQGAGPSTISHPWVHSLLYRHPCLVHLDEFLNLKVFMLSETGVTPLPSPAVGVLGCSAGAGLTPCLGTAWGEAGGTRFLGQPPLPCPVAPQMGGLRGRWGRR